MAAGPAAEVERQPPEVAEKAVAVLQAQFKAAQQQVAVLIGEECEHVALCRAI